MALDYERLVAELTQLRRGPGLTPEALAACPTVLEALGNPSLTEAHQELIALVRGLGNHEPAQVLRDIAYNIDGSSSATLSARRKDYHNKEGRDVKTLIRYENRMIEQLAAQLLRGVERGRLLVTASMKKRRLLQLHVDFMEETSLTPPEVKKVITNKIDRPSLPAFLYTLPMTYTPAWLIVGVLFLDELPSDIWGVDTPHLFEALTLRYPRHILHDDKDGWHYIDYEHPQQEHYYGFGWTW